MRSTLLICALLVNVVTALPLPAGELESHTNIREAARRYIQSRYSGMSVEDIRILPAELDPRLRLTKCDRPLESFSPASVNRGARQTVGVRCNGSVNWTLYVTVKVELTKNVLVANRRLERGEIISKGDFRLEKRMVSGLHGEYIESPDNAVGSVLKLALKRGAVISPRQLRRQPAVTRGSQVIILGRGDGIEVRMSGEALSDGSLGQRIKVRNSSSSRRVEGTVVGRGAVEVTL